MTLEINKKIIGAVLVSSVMFLSACGSSVASDSSSEDDDSSEEENSESKTEDSTLDKDKSDKEDTSDDKDTSAEDKNAPSATEIEIEGDALVQLPFGEDDPAVGVVAPTLRGENFDGDELAIEADGKKKVIYFLAHWCGHCQQEVPMVQELLDDGELPDNLEIYSVSTLEQVEKGNLPEEWLEDKKWTPPVLLDDSESSAFDSYGGAGTPFLVALDGDNKVIARSSGSLSEEATLAFWKAAADS